jgi:cell division FtsZ-interacting protein ZapD
MVEIVANNIMIGNMFRNHPEKRKQMFAINGSLIRDFKIGEDFELMAIAVKQNPLNIKYISNKYRYSIQYMAQHL